MGPNAHDVKSLEAVEREVDELRQRTEALLAELERRIEVRVDDARERVGDVKYKLQRVKRAVESPLHLATHARAHPRAATGIGVGTATAIGLGIWFLIARRAERNRWPNRARRRAIAYRALLANPERALAPRDPSLMKKLVGALLVTVATSLTKRMLSRPAL